MTNDLVSDMLTRIRNASLAKHAFTKIQYSKLNLAILKVLQNIIVILFLNTYTPD
jgi:ribosomal protein S8